MGTHWTNGPLDQERKNNISEGMKIRARQGSEQKKSAWTLRKQIIKRLSNINRIYDKYLKLKEQYEQQLRSIESEYIFYN